jgi:hypothetical protein
MRHIIALLLGGAAAFVACHLLRQRNVGRIRADQDRAATGRAKEPTNATGRQTHVNAYDLVRTLTTKYGVVLAVVEDPAGHRQLVVARNGPAPIPAIWQFAVLSQREGVMAVLAELHDSGSHQGEGQSDFADDCLRLCIDSAPRCVACGEAPAWRGMETCGACAEVVR